MDWKSIIIRVSNVLNILIFISVILFIGVVSINTIYPEFKISEYVNLNIMLCCCILTFIDFWLRFFEDKNKLTYLYYNIIYLVASIPFLNISYYFDIELNSWQNLIIHFLPFIRAGQSLMILRRWGVSKKINNILYNYIVYVVGFTYFSSLIFYQLETSNKDVITFWDAVRWACSNLVTIGSDIKATTLPTQALTFILGACGMMIFPIFTAYLNTIISSEKSENSS